MPLNNVFRQLHLVANETVFPALYEPVPYRPTKTIVRTHLLPRFGYPNDIGVLWGDSNDQIETYIIGVLVGSAVIVGVMSVCLLIMACLKCAGYKRVGFWSGHFEYDGSEDDSVENEDNDDDDDRILNEVDSTLNGDVGSATENHFVSSGIMAVKTIGTGGYIPKSNHVSIAIDKTPVDDELSGIASPLNEVPGIDDGRGDCSEDTKNPLDPARAIGTGEYSERSTHVSIAVNTVVVDNELPEATSALNDVPRINDGAEGSREKTHNALMMHPKPALSRYLVKVARIDPDGKVIDLCPKPVPEVLYFKVNMVRFVFILAGIGAIISAGLFYGLGVKKFQQSLVDTRVGITRFNELALQTINVTDNLLDAVEKVERRLNTTDKAIKVIILRCDLESFANATNFLYHYEEAKGHFVSMSDTIKRLLNGFSEDMLNVLEATNKLYDQLEVLNVAFAFMVLVMCIMIVLIFVMIIGVAFAAYELENCCTCFMRRFLLLPLFVLQVFLATIFSAICMIGALSGSDFCVSPNQHAISMVAKIAAGADESLSPLFTMMLFYLSGCQLVHDDGKVAQALQDTITGADAMLALAHDMINVFNSLTPQEVLRHCNVEEQIILHFDMFGVTLHEITHQLHTSLYQTLVIFSCRSVYPVYSDLVHSAVCLGVVDGIGAIFATMLGIAVLSMFMVALRASMYPIQQSTVPVAATEENGVTPENPEASEIESACSTRAGENDQGQQSAETPDGIQ